MEHCLVTGATGFIGSRVARDLVASGAMVSTLGRRPVSGIEGKFIEGDFETGLFGAMGGRATTVFHAAGLAHRVPRTRTEREAFLRVNSVGTRLFLEALERSEAVPGSLVLFSTVAVYGLEEGHRIAEDAERRPQDAYGRSKAEAEDHVVAWCDRHGIPAAVLRLPLVVGPAAPGNWGALVRAVARGMYVGIGDGSARRSMVLVSDVARFARAIAGSGGVYHVTDGLDPNLLSVERAVAAALGRREPRRIPARLARALARLGDTAQLVSPVAMPFTSRTLRKLTSTLTFSDDRARSRPGWHPTPVLERIEEAVGLR